MFVLQCVLFSASGARPSSVFVFDSKQEHNAANQRFGDAQFKAGYTNLTEESEGGLIPVLFEMIVSKPMSDGLDLWFNSYLAVLQKWVVTDEGTMRSQENLTELVRICLPDSVIQPLRADLAKVQASPLNANKSLDALFDKLPAFQVSHILVQMIMASPTQRVSMTPFVSDGPAEMASGLALDLVELYGKWVKFVLQLEEMCFAGRTASSEGASGGKNVTTAAKTTPELSILKEQVSSTTAMLTEIGNSCNDLETLDGEIEMEKLAIPLSFVKKCVEHGHSVVDSAKSILKESFRADLEQSIEKVGACDIRVGHVADAKTYHAHHARKILKHENRPKITKEKKALEQHMASYGELLPVLGFATGTCETYKAAMEKMQQVSKLVSFLAALSIIEEFGGSSSQGRQMAKDMLAGAASKDFPNGLTQMLMRVRDPRAATKATPATRKK